MMRSFLPAVVCALLLSVSCNKSVPENVAATVNGRPITFGELDKEMASRQNQASAKPEGDALTFARLEMLRSMIDSEIMMQRAEKLNLMATDADVDTEVNKIKAPYTQEEFQRQLQGKHLTLEDVRSQFRRDLSITKLFNKEITSKINITDKDVSEAYSSNKSNFFFAEPQLHLAQILVTPTPDKNVQNLKGDDAKTDAEAQAKIKQIEDRLHRGEDFVTLAQNLSEDPGTSQTGGDMGFLPESALDKADPQLRKAIVALSPGQVSGIQKSQEGYRIFRLISREAAGQRELSDPRVQQNIREMLLNRKDQLLKNAYYEVARNEAKVVNYLALRISQS